MEATAGKTLLEEDKPCISSHDQGNSCYSSSSDVFGVTWVGVAWDTLERHKGFHNPELSNLNPEPFQPQTPKP